MEMDGQKDVQIRVLQDGNPSEDLPDEILQIIRLQETPRFLDVLAQAALNPALTLKLFTRFESVFADTCARWISGSVEEVQSNIIVEAFARILPLAPHLSAYLEKHLRLPSLAENLLQNLRIQSLWKDGANDDLSVLQLQRVLLSTFRLLNFNKSTFADTISGSKIQELFLHADRPVRYLAVRTFCNLQSASDFKLEAMIDKFVGRQEAIMGDFDGDLVDYGFLSLFEESRLKNAYKLSLQIKGRRATDFELPNFGVLSSLVVRLTNTLLPRPNGPPARSSALVATATTTKNIEAFAKSLLSSLPILLHGLAGSGKTSLVNDFARELSVDRNMVTLHLNEQTDAKMLIGMYTTASTPGSFTWRAGVLTTAVKEGRWVFIEDLDRAPNEVISVILPLIERGELLIPSRGEIIKAGPGFKLLASIRTSLNVTGEENPPALHMLGARLWQRVPVQMPVQEEFREIIDGTLPILHEFLPGIIGVYERVYSLSRKPSFASKSRISLGRPISPRDLLKWCRRLDRVLATAGSRTGREPITEATKYEMFLEAIDCFAGSLQTEDTRKAVIECIAEEMHIDPQRVEHFLSAHIPRYDDSEAELIIGRVRLSKERAGRVSKTSKKSRRFANTTHAKRLLEQIGVAVKLSEPILLVGETGIGKTAVVQQLADSLGYKLTTVNLSQQSEVGDLLGGFKPVNIRNLAIPLKDEFDELFASTGISATKNQRYIDQLGKCVAKSQWSKASRLWREAPKMFEQILSELHKKEAATVDPFPEQPKKRQKTESKLQSLIQLKPRWDRFSHNLDQFDIQLSGGSKGFAFTFVEGNIIKAVRNGDWVLLDEINLAASDTLESIADLLHSGSGNAPSILLSETGEIERVHAHPNFRIFGAMNPATDVGKRDLPMGLRTRFTEIYVESPDRNLDDLLGVIKAYLKGSSSNDDRAAHDVARLYLNTKRLADEKRLVDGANQVPHFSLRTLTRVLSYVIDIAPSYGLRRALYEGFAMGFLTLLDRGSEQMLIPLINHHLLDSHGNPQALLTQAPRRPQDGKQYIQFMNRKEDRQYWMLRGSEIPAEQPHYIITPFVERNMLNLVRATSTRRFPVLVQGPTSGGKTSMIEYLARFSGNKFVRINNHEHTDLQEYLGTYVSGSDGQLRFQEGLLVQALRRGYWIVLDELNLAPTDVLEALNRLLDDNRELLIPETQEIVRPHENFMLFATQNPPGLYGGRKTLSRAFRNRFLELHFDDIPEDELHTILEKRSQKVAPSDCKRIVSVYKELSRLRQSNRLFEQKDSFATLRDLFRWALRDADNRDQLAANGYMLLAERVRNPEERLAVKGIIEEVMKVKIDPNVLYQVNLSPEILAYNVSANNQGVVWTQAMRRLYVLVAHALRNNEPVLLVGGTGCGKTTVCQMLADAFGKELYIVNAHQNTETGDLIGAQRPVRNRAAVLEQLRQDLVTSFVSLSQEPSDAHDLNALVTAYRSLSTSDLAQIPEEVHRRVEANGVKSRALFEWSDGSLVQAMKAGQFFLLDEISLADDSVLERLNSVLESQRTILLAEKGVDDSFVQAADGFQFFATMNPGGDYGKRELSPALRNRFTEIWVPSLSEHEDVLQIVEAKLPSNSKQFAKGMVHFAEWFGQTYRSSASTSISVRDVLAWVKFMNGCDSSDPNFAVLHGAAMVYIDTLGANPAALLAINPESIREERLRCLHQLSNLLCNEMSPIYFQPVQLIDDQNRLTIGDFSIAKQAGSVTNPEFAFEAPTTKLNAMRVIRALQVQKPILIEGSPGVGKTTLVAALARACGRPLTRINLSEQTDLMDLFGSDVPVEGAEAGHFAWRDAPFLQAMQKGEWVLLDEMNLASQSVLEGLNACLDHRGEAYISELDQTFKRHPNFSVFAAQNPHHQGGGRKGLPSSFVNRFTVVYADVFRNEDQMLICKHNFPAISDELVASIIRFVSHLEQEIVHKRQFGSQGGPWEFNLRDILRWLELLSSPAPLLAGRTAADFLNLIFRLRFRTPKDRLEVERIFANVFGSIPFHHLFHNMSPSAYQVGLAYLSRDKVTQRLPFPSVDPINRLEEVEAVMICIQQNLPCILVGRSGSGKTTILQHIAASIGKSLITFPLNADIDTMDLVGGYEQVDPQRAASQILEELGEFLSTRVLLSLPSEVPEEAIIILQLLKNGDKTSSSFFSELGLQLRSLETKTSLPEFGNLADSCQKLAKTPMALENARFEWVDGVLIKALEQGKWLVLDNANLCSSSVLDRLNSLLEPNGFLSINEHCGPDGEPKIIRPHPDFRIFLTMDARFGELSRAMRNRAIEIFLGPTSSDMSDVNKTQVIAKPEASMQRYSGLLNVLESETSDMTQRRHLDSMALDSLAWSDLPLLSRFAHAIHNARPLALATQFTTVSRQYMSIYQSEDNQSFRKAVAKMLNRLVVKSGLPQDFIDAQIIHPLQNSTLVPLLQQTPNPVQVFWLAALFELKLSILTALDAQRSQEAGVDKLKPSTMNRLQRSLVSGRVTTVAKDSTVRVSKFLENTLKALNAYVQEHVESDEHWKFQKKVITSLVQYWWDTYHLATSPIFEEATFQAHLAIGADLISGFLKNGPKVDQNPAIKSFQLSLRTDFDSGFKLTTGLSMEVLWKHLRPIVFPKLQVMQALAQLEQLATRFDALRWNASISVSELGGTMRSLVKTYHLILHSDVDCTSLLLTLEMELDRLKAKTESKEDSVTPFLVSQFEALRQFKAIECIRSVQQNGRLVDVDTVILANFPTAAEMRLSSSSNTSRSLQSIDYIWGPGNGLQPIIGNFPIAMLHKLNSLGNVDLKSLKLLESELPIIGEKIASSSIIFGRNQLLDLNEILSQLLVGVIAAHGVNIGKEHARLLLPAMDLQTIKPQSLGQPPKGQDLASSTISHAPDQLQDILKNNFNPASIAMAASRAQLKNSMQFSALAWVHFAIGCITLYVPDKTFDPDKRQRLERLRHVKLRQTLQSKLEAFHRFESLFSGQKSNIRCQLLEDEINELGEPSETMQKIFRPEISELDQLQGEFNNLLKVVVRSNLLTKLTSYFTAMEESELQELRLMQSNVVQIIRRLSERFRAYNDLTTPVICMLRCLQIGLSIATLVSTTSSPNKETRTALSKFTPFLGGGPAVVDKAIITSQPMEYLAFVATIAATEGVELFEPQLRQSLLKAFHDCYEQWAKRLESGRLEAESKAGLYRFRGSAEDEEEEDQEQFNELFPTYGNDPYNVANNTPAPQSARDMAMDLAEAHSNIFLGNRTSSESMLLLIRQTSKQIGSLHEDNSSFEQQNITSALLPGIIVLLNDEIEALSPTSAAPKLYNFYSDANIPETRKLVNLVHHIQVRFRELQAVDEIGHMQTLEDVLVSCRELMNFPHTESIAKLITKVEKVHSFMHEWQFGGWSSRANSAISLYDDITSTIVNWRRLELSTWAKLFDMEIKRCKDDARSWWFIAYQVIIAAPLSLSDSQTELSAYAQKLLKDLEAYFSTAILGQFLERLQLLEQLQKHLELLVLEVPSMSIIHRALTNFIMFFVRYEKPVEDNIKKGREPLEKNMRDVLLLASWKDTNIVALRDSAKRSHHKLFKIVRKFRAVLGQPMEFILKQGLPDDILADGPESSCTSLAQLAAVDLSASNLCGTLVPKWLERKKRFINVSKTINMMADAAQISDTAIVPSMYLDSFLTNIIVSTAELQKATPPIVTEENKDVVKHLKSRKRKLFADVLKDLRKMGIKYNLGAYALATQESLSIILANTKNLPITKTFDTQGLEYYFHKSIDLAPRTREAVRQHSEDLSSAEVARSTGFLEGLLQLILSQRNFLSDEFTSINELQQAIKMANALWAPDTYDIRATNTTSSNPKGVLWLPHILKVALALVKTYTKLSHIDSQVAQDSISAWINTFEELVGHWNALSELPPKIASTQGQDLERLINDSAAQVAVELEGLGDKRPDLRFVLDQILPWTKMESSPIWDNTPTKTLTDLHQKLSLICDAALVAIEKHKNAIADLPTSTEDSGWLAKYNTSHANSIKALHSENINQQLRQAFNILRGLNLEDDKTSKAAGAIFVVALPILQQYYNILHTSLFRYAQFHHATCKTLYILAKNFTQIASQGFCSPSEKSNDQGKTEKLEGGTGLGEGEGAEDISNDIQDDEDLDEIAQEPNQSDKEKIEAEEDAVDMAGGEMDGQMGDSEESGEDDDGSGDDGSGEEMDEEVGDVDDLDPGAVDEKMWDGDEEKAAKDQEGDESQGKRSKDEQVAVQENNKEAGEGDEAEEGDEETVGAEQGEEVTHDEAEQHDSHAPEGDTLDLPDDMDLDGNEGESVSGSDDEMNDFSDAEEEVKDGEEVQNDCSKEPEAENMGDQNHQELRSEEDVINHDEGKDDDGEKTEEARDEPQNEPEEHLPDDQEDVLRNRTDEATADADNAVPSEVQGIGEDQDENSAEHETESTTKAQQDDGGKGRDSSEDNQAAAENGERGIQASGDAPQDSSDETQDSSETQPFKKLGDALESWHRQQSKIREPSGQKEQAAEQKKNEAAESLDFQHLQDEDAQADTQAMGTATEEQAHALDESMVIDDESTKMPETFQPDEVKQNDPQNDVMNLEETATPKEQGPYDAYEGRAGALINQAKEIREELDHHSSLILHELEEDVEEVDNQLESTHLDLSKALELRSAIEARQKWIEYEAITRDLSLSLTEQLRLILAPTLATKMRGDFRTGKRLNIKRIIPYIASQYKRDKIWMRRSVPSKRSYQIMLAVDDSKSMGESGSGSLAFETLVMVSKSLSMLEVGEICVVGFGETVKVAHDFETPFSSDAGPKIFQNFGFEQRRTDVTLLVRESIELFRAARTKANNMKADLWQMELIISDGVCDSSEHEPIRRLLREALEERIMMVFVIVDDLRNKNKGESVMDLKEAKFVKDEVTGVSNVKIERYLDTFPFQYYLIVSDVKELPGVLATLLRQWFAEVVDSSS